MAAALLEEALAPVLAEQHRLRTIGGPEVQDMKSMAQTWKRVTGARGLVAPLPLPGQMGTFLREGRNLVPGEAYGRETFKAWLAKSRENL